MTAAAPVLVLNADWSMLDVVTWQQAISMLVGEKATLVQEYAGRVIRSPSITMPFPAVIVRKDYVRRSKRLRFSRKNVVARDAYTCQYCGAKPRRSSGAPALEDLTLDHVVPRSRSRNGFVRLPDGRRARVTSWENIVTACEPCNTYKADRTPAEAGLSLRRWPRPPGPIDLVWMKLFSYQIPDEWKDYLPEGSPWADYWDGELDPS